MDSLELTITATVRMPDDRVELKLKTTTSSRQISSHLSYILTHTLCYKNIHLHSSNEENAQKKRANLNERQLNTALKICLLLDVVTFY